MSDHDSRADDCGGKPKRGAEVKPPRHGPLADYPRDPVDNWPLCRYCGDRCPTRRNTFCSSECVHEWKIRSSASYAREVVGHRDHGVCAGCGVDTAPLMAELDRLHRLACLGPREARVPAVHAYAAEAERLRGLGFNCVPTGWPRSTPAGGFWQADHITPVEHGGGMAGLDNLQTLCTPCHKAKTRAQAKARRK